MYPTAKQSLAPVGADEEEQGGLVDFQPGVEQRVARPSVLLNIKVGKGSASNVSSVPSPKPAHGGKGMNALKAAVEKA